MRQSWQLGEPSRRSPWPPPPPLGARTIERLNVCGVAGLTPAGSLRSFDRKKSVAYPGRSSVRVATWLPRLMPCDVVPIANEKRLPQPQRAVIFIPLSRASARVSIM